MDCRKVYPYSILQHQIRLIAIPKDAQPERDVLDFELITYSRSDVLRYVALSYAWLKPQNPVPARINNEDCLICGTVDAALRQIYRHGNIDYVWIDQICINQDDLEEKSIQVQHMSQMYMKAEFVVVWLGPEFPDCDLLFQHFSKAGAAAARGDQPFFLELHQDSHYRSVLSEAFETLSQLPYWARLWIIPEFAMARDVKIFCGRLSIAEELVSEFLFHPLISDNASDMPDPMDGALAQMVSTPRSTFVYNVFSRRSLTQRASEEREAFIIVLPTCLGLEGDYNEVLSTDPRDRVFALTQLACDSESFAGLIDYTKSHEEVYCEIAEVFLNQGNIDYICFAQPSKERTPNLPSWVPDWSVTVKLPCTLPKWYSKFTAGGDSNEQAHSFPRPGQLLLHGVHIDTVKELGKGWDPIWGEPVDKEEALTYIEDIIRLCKKSPRIKSQQEVLEGTRIASLDAAHWNNKVKPSDVDEYMNDFIWGYERLQQQVSELKCETESEHSGDESNPEQNGNTIPRSPHSESSAWQDVDDSSKDDDWLLDELEAQHTRRCFMTKNGFVGVGPSHLEEDDEICIFYDGFTPYALRQQEDATYILVGDVYVHGIMYGEFLRDKPERRTFVLR